MSLIPTGAYINNVLPWWSQDIFGTPANIEVSTLTVNPIPAGNILLQNPAPLIFQRPVGDLNAPSESLVMISSIDVPTKPINGQYITATKALGTAYDDIAVEGIQIFGNQTTSGNSGAIAYITGNSGNLILSPKNSVFISSLAVSSLIAGTIVSTAVNTATSYTATLFMSTPYLDATSISSANISTNTIQGVTGNFSTLNVSTLNAPSFVASTLSTISIDAKVTLTSTLTLLGVSSVNLGLGDVIQGLVGGATTQALGAGLGGAGLITGVVALATGRTSGGVNSNVFQTINGSTQLQFSTIGSAVSSVFLTTISPNPLTTPGLETSTTIGVDAGTYCVRSVGDPLYITNNASSIQMFGQWVPVIQPTATASALAISSFNVSSINGATYPPPGSAGIPSTIALSTATINGNFTQSGTGTFNWGGNTMSPTQVVLNRPTAVNNTLTTTGGTFLNAGATINNGLIVGSGGATITGGVNVNSVGVVISNGGLFVNNATTLNGGMTASGTATFNNQVNMLQNASVSGFLNVSNGMNVFNGLSLISGNFTMNQFGASANVPILNATQTIRSPAISTINISTGNINVSSVNGATYPPGGGGGIPSTLNASTINVNGGQTITNGSLIVSGGISVVNGGLAVNSGNVLIQDPTQLGSSLLVSGLATLNGNLNTPAINTNTISTGSIVANAISTNTISSASLFISSINNAVYPPPGGGGIPSTLNASTLNVNGGQTITNGGLVVSGGNVTIQNPATMNNSLTILGQTAAVGGLVVEAPGAIFNGPIGAANTIQVAGLALLNGGARASFLSTNTISSASLLISSINNVSYPPPAGIPSTLNASTLNVNGGQTITNGGITISGGGTISDGGLWRYRMASIASAISFQQAAGNNDSLILDLKSDKTTRFYSTLLVRDSTWPTPQPSQASIRTYDTTDPAPYGSVVTANISTLNINISTINGATYPAPSPGIVPTGAITIWAGGSDGGSSLTPQNFAVPAGWLACDGLAVSQIVYNALYTVIGNKYSRGVVPNPGLFFLPDLTFAVPMGTPFRNYFSNENLAKPNFSISFETWSSTYVTDPSEACWKITQTNGGTLNLGTKFMGGTVSFSTVGPWPNIYVTQILQYDGYQGYIIVRNENNLLPVPTTNGANLTISANGVVDRFPTTTGDYIYTLGTPGVFGRNNVTHNQTDLEAAVHTHGFGSGGINGPSLVVLAGSIGGPVLPTGAQTSPPNTLSTISSITTGPTGFSTTTNIGTYTAPNFINMLYIIKT
jgi:hypothetical protein